MAWALLELSAAGKRGLTVIERPAMRWAAYVHSLRRMGFSIETELEPHGGDFAGHHARYRLHTDAMLQVIRWRGTITSFRANQAAAFERMSRSTLSCRFSLRSRCSSSRSLVMAAPTEGRPAPRPVTVRRVMLKHGLAEPAARVLAALAYGAGHG